MKNFNYRNPQLEKASDRLPAQIPPVGAKNPIHITPGFPETRKELGSLLRGARRLLTFDHNTALIYEASLCGAQTILVNPSEIEFTSGPWSYEELPPPELDAQAWWDKPIDNFIEISHAYFRG
jgi:hypothetical protein